MKYSVVYCEDKGIVKKINQDSLLVKHILYKNEEVLLAIVCDGMGGLQKGELASKTVIEAFAEWFDNEIVGFITDSLSSKKLFSRWKELINENNKKLMEYGARNNISLGTTLSLILFYKKEYYIAHIGDGRIYFLLNEIYQLTKDQTVVQREIDNGIITNEEAKTDSRRSILL